MRQNAVLGASGFVGVDLVTCGYFLVLVHSLVNSGHFVVFWDFHGNRVSQAMVERNGADDARIQSPRLCFHFGCEYESV